MNNMMWQFTSSLNELMICTPWFIVAIFDSHPDPAGCKLLSGYFFGVGSIELDCGDWKELQWKYVKHRIWREVTLYDVFIGRCDRLGNL